MKKMCRLALTFALAALIAFPVLAQKSQKGSHSRGQHSPSQHARGFGGGFGGGSTYLLSQESVQKDLKLSSDQVAKIKDLQKKQRESFQGLRNLKPEELRTKIQERAKANRKAVDEILKPEQQKRLKQITLQREGAGALRHKEVAEALKITDEQKGKIKAIYGEAFKDMGKLRGGNNQDARKKFSEVRKSTSEKVMNVLTSEQKTKLKEIEGEPFKGEIRMPQFGGGQRGGQHARR